MKFHLTQAEGNYLITGYAPGRILINQQPYSQSLIVMPQKLMTDWKVADFESLAESHFTELANMRPELVILGTGTTHRFIHPRIIMALTQQQIPLECMTTDAACRTYNILMSEGRNVAAALIV